MSDTRFALGVVVGGLLVLTPLTLPAMCVIGGVWLVRHGLAGGDGVTAGVGWVSALADVILAILVALLAVALGLWHAPAATLLAVAAVAVGMYWQRCRAEVADGATE